MLHTRQSIYLVLTNVLSASFLMFYITFDEISATLSIQFWYRYKCDACGTMICSYFGITFLLFFMKIENAVLHILPKLSNEHIKLTSYSKMNVRLAAQVLSSVSKVLLAYSPPEAAETARFFSLMD